MPSSASSNHVATTAYLVGQYVGALRARRCSPETIRIVRSILTGCLSQRLGRRLDELTYDDLLAWQTLRAGEISSRSLRTQVSYVRRFYAWAHDEGLIPSNPAHRLRPPKVSQAPPRPITETRLARAMAAGDPTMRAILGLAAFAGLRACEIARLTWSDCYLDEDEPVLRVLGKGDREGIVDVSDELRELLLALPGPRRGPVFRRRDGKPGHNKANRISQLANEFLHEHDVPDTLHSLRHRFITQVARLGGIHRARDAARHANVSTTSIYTKVLRSEVRPLVEQVGRLLPSAS
jgi:integrase